MTVSPTPKIPAVPKQAEFADVVIAGRNITVKRPNEVQATMIHRSGRIGQAAADKLERLEADKAANQADLDAARGAGMDAISEMLDMIERLVASAQDRAWLVEAMKNGDIELGDLSVITTAFVPEGKRATKASRVK